jgi:hypothetical protein
METDGRPEWVQEQLHEMERGETASWIVYPPTPAWWAVGFGLWAACFVLVVGVLDGTVEALAELGLVLGIGAMMGWDRRRRGTYPNGRPPREFHWAIVRMVLGAAAVGGLAWLAGSQLSLGLAAVIAGAGAWAVVAWYEHEYAAIAARLRARLQ